MLGKFLHIECIERIRSKARRIVDDQAERWLSRRLRHDGRCRPRLAKVGRDLDGACRNIVTLAPDMGNHRPTVGDQRFGQDSSDSLACSGDDCRPWFALAHGDADCAGTPRMTRASAMPETRPQIPLAGQSLAALATALEDRSLPPVDRWNPTHCGDSAMRIASDGTWFHMGTPIPRPAMVRLFSTVLRREPDGSHVLVTPVEKLTIAGRRHPVSRARHDQRGRRRSIDRSASRSTTPTRSSSAPTIRCASLLASTAPNRASCVRGGLEAQLARPVYYELADLALAKPMIRRACGATAPSLPFPNDAGRPPPCLARLARAGRV